MAKTTKTTKQKQELRSIAAGEGGRPSKPAAAGSVRVGVWLDPALHRRAKVRAAELGTTLSAIVARALEKELG